MNGDDGNPISPEADERLRALELQCAVVKRDLEAIKEDLGKINGGIGRVLWVIGGGILMAAVSWMLNGGFNGRIQ